MAYTKVGWTNNVAPYINERNLGHMDEGIANVDGSLGYDAYDNTQTYSVGAYCIYNNKLYVCNTAIATSEEFDSSKWSETSIKQITQEIQNTIDEINLSNKYSTSEVKTNKVWINNKPIYRKVVQIDLTSEHSSNYSTDHNISNIDQIIHTGGYMIRTSGGSGFVEVNTYAASSYRLVVQSTTTQVNCQNQGFLGNLYAILEYTKTTD